MSRLLPPPWRGRAGDRLLPPPWRGRVGERGRHLPPRPVWWLLLVCLLPYIGQQPAAASLQGASYYVAPAGSDTAPGNLDRPFKTIAHALEQARAGDSVVLRGGSYSEPISLARGGAPGRPLTIAAYGVEAVFLDGDCAGAGTGCAPGTPGVHALTDGGAVSDVTIDGLVIRNFDAEGLLFPAINDRLVLRNLVIRDNSGAGIRLSNSDGSRLENVTLQRNRGGLLCAPLQPGTDDDPGCTNLSVVDSRLLDNTRAPDSSIAAFSIQKGHDIQVERTRMAGSLGSGFDIRSDRTTLRRVTAEDARANISLVGRDVRLENVLAFDATGDTAVILGGGGSYSLSNVTVANLIANGTLIAVGDGAGAAPTSLNVQSSILYNDRATMNGPLLWLSSSVQLDRFENNLFWNPSRPNGVLCIDAAPYSGQCFGQAEMARSPGSAPGTGNRYADPRFARAAAKDFHIQRGSPAIDEGSLIGVPTDDLDGNARDDHPDIGAFEYRS